MKRSAQRFQSTPPEGIHDQVTAVNDAAMILEEVKRATRVHNSHAAPTTKVNAFDLADALHRTREEEELRYASGTRPVVRPEETTYAHSPADAVEIVHVATVPVSSEPPPADPEQAPARAVYLAVDILFSVVALATVVASFAR